MLLVCNSPYFKYRTLLCIFFLFQILFKRLLSTLDSHYLYTFIYRAEHRAFINPSEVRVELQPFGKFHEKVCPTKALTDITRSREWNCILLKFKDYRDLRVGFSLTKDEITFLIGELKRSVIKVNSQTLLGRNLWSNL